MLLPVIILTALCIWTIVDSIQNTVVIGNTTYEFDTLTSNHFRASIALIICLISFFAFRAYFKYVLFMTLILGLLGVLEFRPSETYFVIKISSLEIDFQLTSFFVGILTLIVGADRINEVLEVKGNQNTKQIAINKQARFSEEVENFKNTYRNKSSESLKQIVAENKYVAPALEAARQLLDERGSN